MTASACMAALARSWANTRDQLDELQPGGEGFKELAAGLHAMESAIAITEPKSVVDYAIKVVVGLGDGVLSEMQATMLIEAKRTMVAAGFRLPEFFEARAVGRGALPSAKVGGSPDA